MGDVAEAGCRAGGDAYGRDVDARHPATDRSLGIDILEAPRKPRTGVQLQYLISCQPAGNKTEKIALVDIGLQALARGDITTVWLATLLVQREDLCHD
jgi:hypothetical protein